jgi:transcriptional/translational regulatory protein YebC/TACO1
VRSTFSKAGASLGEAGCVAWNFETKGVITLETDPSQAEDIALLAIEASADDVKVEDGYLEIHTQPEDLEAVRKELEGHQIDTSSAEISMMPKSTVSLGVKEADQTLRLLDSLEDLLDVQKVYSNADFPDEALEKYRGEG